MTRAQSASKRSANKRCSTLMNSCRRRSASLAASPNAISTSGLTLMGTDTLSREKPSLLRFGCHPEGHLVLFCVLADLQGLGLRDVPAEHSGDPETLVMDTQ